MRAVVTPCGICPETTVPLGITWSSITNNDAVNDAVATASKSESI